MFFKNWPPEWMCPYLRTPTTTQMQTPSWFYETFPVTELAKGTWKLHCTLYLKKKKGSSRVFERFTGHTAHSRCGQNPHRAN